MEQIENFHSNNETQPLPDFTFDVRQFLRGADEFERIEEFESPELMNLEIETLSLLKSMKIDPKKEDAKPKKIIKWTYINAKDRKKRKLKCPHCERIFESVSIKSLQHHC